MTIIMSDDAPPTGTDAPPTGTLHTHGIKGAYPQYAETPMPDHDGYDADSDADEGEKETSVYSGTLYVLFIAIAIAHLWTVWTLRTDINIVLEYQKEHALQYKHITSLLQNMKQVQWQIVPAINP